MIILRDLSLGDCNLSIFSKQKCNLCCMHTRSLLEVKASHGQADAMSLRAEAGNSIWNITDLRRRGRGETTMVEIISACSIE